MLAGSSMERMSQIGVQIWRAFMTCLVNPRRACARVTVVVLCEGYDTGLLGVRDFRISVISN